MGPPSGRDLGDPPPRRRCGARTGQRRALAGGQLEQIGAPATPEPAGQWAVIGGDRAVRDGHGQGQQHGGRIGLAPDPARPRASVAAVPAAGDRRAESHDGHHRHGCRREHPVSSPPGRAHGDHRRDDEQERRRRHRRAHPAPPGALGRNRHRQIAGPAPQLQDRVPHTQERALPAVHPTPAQAPPPEPPAHMGAIGRAYVRHGHGLGRTGQGQMASRDRGVRQNIGTAERTSRGDRKHQSGVRPGEHGQVPGP